MLTFFFQRISDETLYSTVAAAFILSGYPSFGKFIRLNFGGKKVDIHSLIPESIETLIKNLGFEKPSTTRAISDISLFPYYRPFYPPKVLEKESKIRTTDRKIEEDKANRFQRKHVGINNFHYVRMCVNCVLEQLSCFGRSAWLRTHQLPYVSCCWKHGNLLNTVQIAKSEACLPQHFKPITDHNLVNQDLIWLAKSSAQLLHEDSPTIPQKVLDRVYRSKIIDMGFGTANKLDHGLLQQALAQVWQPSTLSKLENYMRYSYGGPWITRLLHRSKIAEQPIMNLLLIRLVYSDVRSFFSAVREESIRLP